MWFIHSVARPAVGVFSGVLYVSAHVKEGPGYVIPLTAAFVHILIGGGDYFVFKETVTALKIGGIVVILGGSIVLRLGR